MARQRYSQSDDLAFGAMENPTRFGTTGDDVLIGDDNRDSFYMYQGGNDTVSGERGDDSFVFLKTLNKLDTVDGGGGYDKLIVGGLYEGGLVIGRDQLRGIERIDVLGTDQIEFHLTLEANAIAARQVQVVTYGDKGSLDFDGSAVMRGSFDLRGSLFNDHLVGGGGDDMIWGGGRGQDILTGGQGADRFRVSNGVYSETPRTPDLITDFENVDKLDLSDYLPDGFHIGATRGRDGDIVLDYSAGADQTTISIFVDGDRRADLIVLLTGDHTDLTLADFSF